MKDNLKQPKLNAQHAAEENLINWNQVLNKFQEAFGKDVYDSWIQNINLKSEFNNYVVCLLQLDLLEIGLFQDMLIKYWILSKHLKKAFKE